MKQVEINGATYCVPRLTPWDAFHVMRRVSPLLVGIGPQILQLAVTRSDEAKAAGILTTMFSDAGVRFAQMLAMMTDADMDYVALKCLGSVTVRQDTVWAKILAENSARPMPMFQFITPAVIVRLIIEVLKVELTDFLAVSNYSGAATTTAP